MKLAALAVLASACTTLGPVPALTGVSAIPTDRPGVEVQAGLMPAFLLSESAQESPRGGGTQQLSAVAEPDRLLGTKGLLLGVRTWGQGGDRANEPMLGYRYRYDERTSFAAIGYGTRMAGTNQGASYRGTHLGGELAADFRLFGGPWLATHLQVTGSLTYLKATGTYCVDSDGWGTDCESDESHNDRVDAVLRGLFPAATAAFTLDIARRPTGVLHGIRLAFLATLGSMPVVRYGDAFDNTTYASAGLALTVGLGGDR